MISWEKRLQIATFPYKKVMINNIFELHFFPSFPYHYLNYTYPYHYLNYTYVSEIALNFYICNGLFNNDIARSNIRYC